MWLWLRPFCLAARVTVDGRSEHRSSRLSRRRFKSSNAHLDRIRVSLRFAAVWRRISFVWWRLWLLFLAALLRTVRVEEYRGCWLSRRRFKSPKRPPTEPLLPRWLEGPLSAIFAVPPCGTVIGVGTSNLPQACGFVSYLLS